MEPNGWIVFGGGKLSANGVIRRMTYSSPGGAESMPGGPWKFMLRHNGAPSFEGDVNDLKLNA